MRISKRAREMKYSAVRKLLPLAIEAEKKGLKAIQWNEDNLFHK